MKLNFSIRTKLTFWYTFALVFILFLVGSVTYFYLKSTLASSLDLTLKNEINWLQKFLENKEIKKKKTPQKENLKNKKPKIRLETIDETKDSIWYQMYEHAIRSPKKTMIKVVNKKNKIVFISENIQIDDSLFIPSTNDTGIILTTYKHNLDEIRLAFLQTKYGTIWVAYPLEELESILNNLFLVFKFSAPISVLISILIGYIIAKKSLKPIDEIIETAQKISSSTLSQQIPPRFVNDELGRLISTINDMLIRLQNSFELTQMFSIDASHELRTPLTIIRGEIETTLNETDVEKLKETFSSIHEETLRMQSIIDSLMLIARTDYRQYKPNWENVQLNSIIEELFEDVTILANKKSIEIQLLKNDEFIIIADLVRLRQLLLNLTDNAIKYTPECGKVFISSEHEKDFAVIKIKDTGIGIPKNELPKIFNRFYRVDKARSRELGGSGLGLSIAKWIVHLHNGRIEVQSIVEQGTTFTIKLPINQPT